MSYQLLALFLFISAPLMAQWHEPYCAKVGEKVGCEEAVEEDQINSLVPGPIQKMAMMSKGARELIDSIEDQADQWGDLTRWLKGHKTKTEDIKALENQWKDLEIEGRALLEVNSKLASFQKKKQVCSTMCHPSTKIELQDQVEFLTKLKTRMTAASPFWISEEFLEVAVKEKSEDLPNDKLKELFVNSMGSFFEEARELQAQSFEIERALNRSLNETEDPEAAISSLFVSYPNAVDAILRRKVLETQGHERDLMCEVAENKSQYDKVKSGSFKTFQFGLLAAGMLVGPEAFLASKALSSGAKAGWIKALTTRLSSKPKALAIGSDATLSSTFITDWAYMTEQCKQDLALTKLEAVDQSEWEECLRKRNNAKIGAMLAPASTLGSVALPKVFDFVNKVSEIRPTPFFKKNIKSGDLIVMDLSRKSEFTSAEMKALPDKYWEYVSETYKARLNLSAKEVDDFISSSRALEPRTTLMVATKEGSTSKINGGVAIVESKSAHDLLPLEKATGIKISRENGPVAEIVRLTADKEAGGFLYAELMKEIATFFKSRPDIKRATLFTSKTHARLYKRLGVPTKDLKESGGRDVVAVFDAQDFINNVLKSD